MGFLLKVKVLYASTHAGVGSGGRGSGGGDEGKGEGAESVE